MSSIHHSSATGVELSSRVLLYGGERVEVTDNGTHWAGRRGIAYGPARNGKQSIVELEPLVNEPVASRPVGIVVSASDFLVIDEEAVVSAAESVWIDETAEAEAQQLALQGSADSAEAAATVPTRKRDDPDEEDAPLEAAVAVAFAEAAAAAGRRKITETNNQYYAKAAAAAAAKVAAPAAAPESPQPKRKRPAAPDGDGGDGDGDGGDGGGGGGDGDGDGGDGGGGGGDGGGAGGDGGGGAPPAGAATDEDGAVPSQKLKDAVLTLAGVMIRDDVISTFFGVDDERIANKLNSDADYSELKDLPASDWPVSHCAYGPDFLVNVFSSVDKSTVRREVGIKLLASNMAGLVNVDASSLVPSATDAHAARGRGIELALLAGRARLGARQNRCANRNRTDGPSQECDGV